MLLQILLSVMLLLLEEERAMLSLLLLTLLPVIVLLPEEERMMPNMLLLHTLLFDIVLSSVFQSSIPTVVLDKSRFSTVILLQLTSITCPAALSKNQVIYHRGNRRVHRV